VSNLFEGRVDDAIGLIVVLSGWLIFITGVSPVCPRNVSLFQVLDCEIPPFVLSVLAEFTQPKRRSVVFATFKNIPILLGHFVFKIIVSIIIKAAETVQVE